MFHSAKGISLAGECQYAKAGGDVTIWRQFSRQASASICSILIDEEMPEKQWRREGDSNPRYGF
jgi:hypothetical protein